MIIGIKEKNKTNLKIAYFISRIFEPFLWLAFLGILLIFSNYFKGYERLYWAFGLAFFLGGLPLLTLWIGFKKIKDIDIDFTKKEKRTPFILIILFYWLIGLVLVWALSGPKLILNILLIGIILNFLVLVINFYWKVSNHSLVITAVALFINQLFGWQYVWLFIFVPLVCWARHIQKKHTWGQLGGGIILGFMAWLLLIIFGY